jgi:hypothetical protein
MTPSDATIPLQQRQELVRRLLSSRQFAHAESLRRIVNLLFERSQADETAAVREQQIAIEALGRPSDFDPKVDPIVRVSIASIRERIRDYFEREGRQEHVRLSLPKGQYRLQFAAHPEGERHSLMPETACSRFWSPYLSPANPNILVYTELLFFRDPDGNFIRNIYVNDRASGEAEIRGRLGLGSKPALRPSFHFVSAGEMASLLAIDRVFSELGASLEYRNSRFFKWSDARRSNLILLGSARTNSFVRSLQGGLPFTITATEIQVSDPRPGESPVYAGQRYPDGELERLVEYALVTRGSGPVQGTTVTMISANHGRAIEGAGRFLSEESHLRGLEEAFAPAPLTGKFQLILRIEMLDFDEEVVDVRYVTHRHMRD